MAELILTDKEKADPTYLDWSDEALGRLVKKSALMLCDEYGQDSAYLTTGAHLMVGMVEKINSTKTTFTVEGFSIAGEPKGDWKITIERLDKHPESGSAKE